ncbi:glycoside hydrolase family 127 protein [Butyrivibrio sp. LC3010]|uniref:glycoside hydrolase family 127 protein n=1 Tax=Butyrivibrio sp. LC3010 TaxID=1280680 RepID=UPI00041C66FC|nr:beta-L-arabinofuranosidase domain-containing protein [Butyrivibrio sp. LC3010]
MKYKANSTIPLSDIKINDGYFNKYRDLVGKVIIPYQWDVLNDRLEDVETSHCIENFKIAAGLSNGSFQGAVFQDTDLAKWLEAVGFYLSSYGRDEKLEKLADDAIDLIEKAQQPDGYLDTYFIICAPDKKWKNLQEGHELYTAGHMMEAAVAYYEATGKEKFLNVVRKLADLLVKTFGDEDGKCKGYPGHPEVEVGLIKLYRITGEKKYLELARFFVNARGVGENYFLEEEKKADFERIFPDFNDYDPAYSQSHKPVREQKTAEGHAVRAVYLYSAMADLAAEYGDDELTECCINLWDNIVHKRMYITGSIGSSGFLERFTTDYDLPNDCNYSESCASIGLAMFGKRMAELTHDATYFDDVERALYNTVLSGIAMDGKGFFYVNPLEVWPDACMEHTSRAHVKSERQKWFGVACCPPNIARTLASLGQYIFCSREDGIDINLFISSETKATICDKPVIIRIDSRIPWEGDVKIQIESIDENDELAGEIYIRVPYYAENCVVGMKADNMDIDGAEYEISHGYIPLTLKGKSYTVTMKFDMKASFVHANPLVRADSGKVAIMKGPLVYCLEEQDNFENLASVFIKSDAEIGEEFDTSTFGGSAKLSFDGFKLSEEGWDSRTLYGKRSPHFDKVKLTAIPYAYWGNRQHNREMIVWIKEINHIV